MDDKLTPLNSSGEVAKAPGVTPEDLRAGGTSSEAAPVEKAPTPGSSPAPAGSSPHMSPTQKLTADQVAAVIASTPTPAAPTPVAGTPSFAADVDVIEPEWVNKAESVVAEHRGDPYGEEEAVEDLQQDYLKKRYGYEVGKPNSDKNKPEGT
jgi:hypothetical protein